MAIRYPRGGEGSYTGSDWHGRNQGTVVSHRAGKDVTFVTYGTLLDNVMSAANVLSEQGIEATVLRLLSVSDIDAEQILEKMAKDSPVIVAEEVCSGSGIREALFWELRKKKPDCRVEGIDLGSGFVTHGSQQKLYEICGLDSVSIAAFAKEVLSK